MSINRKYKDTVFRRLFNTQEKLLELYNALFGTNYKDWSAIKINTLDNVLFMGMRNDISFVIYGVLVLLEHQSTINKNLAARMFLYLSKIYEKIASEDDPNALYKWNAVEFPNPEFIVLYNGKEDFPKEEIINITTVFKNKDRKNRLDMEVRVININKGVNPELESKSKTLADYISLITKIREYETNNPLEKSIKLAVKYCIENDILKEFLLEHAQEVVGMLATEFDMDIALEVAHRDGMQTGIEKGREEGREQFQNYVLDLMAQGLSYEEIKKIIEENKKVQI
jgi:predicted transposase/invertase (TIGR01784 family)